MAITSNQIEAVWSGKPREGVGATDAEFMSALELFVKMTADQRKLLAHSVGCTHCFENDSNCQCWNDE